MRKVLDFLERQPPSTILGLSFLLVSIIGLIDSLSGSEISLSVFYLIPIVLSASYVDFWAGTVMSLASVIVFLIADRILSVSYSTSAIPYWNSGVRLFFYLAVSYFIAKQKTAEKQLSQSEERFRLLVEGAVNYSILMLDRTGSIVSWNAGAERIFGYQSQEILGQSFSHFYLDQDVEIKKPEEDLIKASQLGKLSEEVWRIRKDRSRFWADVILTCLQDNNGNIRGFSLLTRDMSERKKAEEAVRVYAQLHEIDRAILAAGTPEKIAWEALDRIQNLVPADIASVTCFDVDLDQATILAVNGKGNQLNHPAQFPLDIEEDDAIEVLKKGEIQYIRDTHDSDSLPFSSAFPLNELRSCINIPLISQTSLIGSLHLGSTVSNGFHQGHLEISREIANQVAVAIHGARLFEEVRGAHQRLQMLSHRLLEVQETEKRHLARELHDEMGQALTAVRIQLEDGLSSAGNTSLSSRLRESIVIVEKLLQQVRYLSLDLRPLVLDDLGLVAALRWYVSRQAQLGGFTVHFSENLRDAHFSPDLETTCFRVAQEAVTNIIRHAGAKIVNVEIVQQEGVLQLLIKDDGSGFDMSAAQERTSHGDCLGLLSMRERVSLLDGKLEMESVPGFGTEIRAKFPLKVQPGVQSMKPIRVLIVDDHTLVRDGIRALLDADEEITVVAEAQDGLEAMEMIPIASTEHRFDGYWNDTNERIGSDHTDHKKISGYQGGDALHACE